MRRCANWSAPGFAPRSSPALTHASVGIGKCSSNLIEFKTGRGTSQMRYAAAGFIIFQTKKGSRIDKPAAFFWLGIALFFNQFTLIFCGGASGFIVVISHCKTLMYAPLCSKETLTVSAGGYDFIPIRVSDSSYSAAITVPPF